MAFELITERLKTAHGLDPDTASAPALELALKEIAQEIALRGLAVSGFFKRAVFHGGTCLRIIHRMRRFSEDLDFALISPDRNFDPGIYLKAIQNELRAMGLDAQIQDKSRADFAVTRTHLINMPKAKFRMFERDKEDEQKARRRGQSHVEHFLRNSTKSQPNSRNCSRYIYEMGSRHFVKMQSIEKVLDIESKVGRRKHMKIKVEIDTNPPAGQKTASGAVLWPSAFAIVAQDLPTLFAGKIHAALCRGYEKGRDWHDFLWYVERGVPPNFEYLKNALVQSNHADEGDTIDLPYIRGALKKRLQEIDFKKIKDDVRPLVENGREIDMWTKEVFLDVIERM